VQVLLRSNVDANAVNRNGDTPLSIAAFFGHDSIVAQLIDHMMSKPSSPTANMISFSFVHGNDNGYTPLMLAAAGGHVDVAQRLLLFRQKNFKMTEHLEHLSDADQTALAIAADYNHANMVALLRREGAKEV
jgi:ankyrin repeat protein